MYIRFGELPEGGKSINFYKATFEQQDRGKYPDDVRENGISVFAMADGLPLLTNLELAKSLHARVGAAAYIVDGIETGTGADGEPLLADVRIVSEYTYAPAEMYSLVIAYLRANYTEIGGKGSGSFMGTFYRETKRNTKTGEVIDMFKDYGAPGYEKLKPYHVISCNGIEFKEERE